MKLVVLGAGWLGKPLCEHALKQGWQVQGTKRTVDDTVAYQRQFYLEGDTLTHTLDLTDAYWVCAIPPRARHADSNYLATLKNALQVAQNLNAKGFLLCSSTGVYSEADGIYHEQAQLDDQTPRKQILRAAESLVLEQGGKVARLAGLVGPNRMPGQFVAGKALKSASAGKVNMVHQADVISAVMTLINTWSKCQNIYNVCHPWHPTRAEYYQLKCAQLGTEAPTFASDTASARVIDGSAIESLGFKYSNSI